MNLNDAYLHEHVHFSSAVLCKTFNADAGKN